MANKTLAPYKGHPSAELSAFEHGSDPDTMVPELVWECPVTAADLEAAARTIILEVGATPTNGDYETRFYDEGDVLIATVTTPRAGAVPATNDDLALQHGADIEAETDLDEYRSAVTVDGSIVRVELVAGSLLYATPSAPAPGTMVTTNEMAIDLNELRPNDAFPAPSLRGEAPVLRVTEAFPAGSTATLDDEGAASTSVLSGVAISATGWVGDPTSTLGVVHSVELSWAPRLVITTTAANPFPTIGELKVQVTHSPLPE